MSWFYSALAEHDTKFVNIKHLVCCTVILQAPNQGLKSFSALRQWLLTIFLNTR